MVIEKRKCSKSFTQESRTKQSFRKECDINFLMAKYQKTGILNHVNRTEPMYMDCQEIDLQTAINIVNQGKEMFMELPSDVRKMFNNNPVEYMEFVQNPENRDKLVELGIEPNTADLSTAKPANLKETKAEQSAPEKSENTPNQDP